ncbi:hypothetical protein [Gymnodinialimonas sp.]
MTADEFDAMLTEGWLEEAERFFLTKGGFLSDEEVDRYNAKAAAAPSTFKTTEKALRLTYVRFVKRMTREEADTLLAKVLGRIDQYKVEFPDSPVFMQRLEVFGSYLEDTDDIEDLDLIPTLVRSLRGEEYQQARIAFSMPLDRNAAICMWTNCFSPIPIF